MSFEFECCKKRRKNNARLITLVKHYKKYNSLWDEQILLAGVINCLVKNNFKISNNEIYYSFKKNYNREFHGDSQSYLKWLYSLAQPSKKTPYNSITSENKALSSKKNELTGVYTPNDFLAKKMPYKTQIKYFNSDDGK